MTAFFNQKLRFNRKICVKCELFPIFFNDIAKKNPPKLAKMHTV